ncbi:MAG: hypothetical protein ACI3XI_04715 [Eubacteriales bacterium]
MKTVKNISSAIAVFLCILICIYVLTLYLKFKPKEPAINDDGTVEEVPGKIEQFLDSNVQVEEHLTLVFLLAISAASGFLLERMPSFGVLSAAGALAYALTMFRFEALPKFPKSIIIFTIAHVAGALFYAATSERGRAHSRLGMNSAASGGLLCNTAALGTCVYLLPILSRLAENADKLAQLEENKLVISTKFAIIPNFVDMIWRAFETRGYEHARSVLLTLTRQYETEGIAEDFELTFVGEEYGVYLKLAILLLGVIVLSLVLRRRAWAGALLALVPPVYVFHNMLYDRISTATLILLTFTAVGAVGAFAAYQREGAPVLVDENGYESETEEDDDPTSDELPQSDAEDDGEGESIPDEECERLDYFYEKPQEIPTDEERAEYLEIKEDEAPRA